MSTAGGFVTRSKFFAFFLPLVLLHSLFKVQNWLQVLIISNPVWLQVMINSRGSLLGANTPCKHLIFVHHRTFYRQKFSCAEKLPPYGWPVQNAESHAGLEYFLKRRVLMSKIVLSLLFAMHRGRFQSICPIYFIFICSPCFPQEAN